MSSAQNKSHQSSKLASSSKPSADDPAKVVPQPPSSAENAMDQPLDSPLIAVPPAPPTPSETMSSTDPSSSSTESSSIESASTASTESTTPPQAAESSPSGAVSTASAGTSSKIPASEGESAKQSVLRQQPIPPASEPMQYRAIGLIRGKYVPSGEQFTRGEIITDDGVEIGAVLLGRVMSLVKKHLDLEQSHLWVVYPRTREKGDGNLHVQIVGVWEPENLNREMADSALSLSEDESEDDLDLSDDLVDEAMVEDETDETLETLDDAEDDADDERFEDNTEEPAIDAINEETGLVEAEATESELEAVNESSEAATTDTALGTTTEEKVAESDVQVETETELAPSDTAAITPSETGSESNRVATESTPAQATADDLDDRYFSVRGEVIYQSIEDKRLLVKIRRAPRPGTTENKAFKVMLVGALEGKAVGYFWDLHVQREGNMLVVQEGTMIGAVPPQKRSKRPPFNQRRGGGGRRPQGGPPRKRWQNRDGQQRPTRSGGSDRPTPPQNRENRPPSPRPIKRRNLDNPES